MIKLELKCLPCVSEYLESEGTDFSVVHDAITFAPSWQEKFMSNTVVVTCVTVPVCINHIGKQPETVAEKMAKSGLAIPGMLWLI